MEGMRIEQKAAPNDYTGCFKYCSAYFVCVVCGGRGSRACPSFGLYSGQCDVTCMAWVRRLSPAQ